MGLPFLFYIPISEQASLLSAPAMAHELGHVYSQYYEDELFHDFEARYGILKLLAKAKARLLRFSNKLKRRERARIYHNIISNWYEWCFEIACDVFATYLLGPAFALYMTSFLSGSFPFKKTSQLHTHPSANLRVRIILRLLQNKAGENELLKYLKDGWSKYFGISEEDDEDTIDRHEWSEQFISLYVDNLSTVHDSLGLKFVSLPSAFYGLNKRLLQKYEPQSLVEAINIMWLRKVVSQNENLEADYKNFLAQFIV